MEPSGSKPARRARQQTEVEHRRTCASRSRPRGTNRSSRAGRAVDGELKPQLSAPNRGGGEAVGEARRRLAILLPREIGSEMKCSLRPEVLTTAQCAQIA